jgi:hypothetical protein
MTPKQVIDVLALKPKLDGYHATKAIRLTPADVSVLQAAASSIGIPRTDWWCASCAISRMAQLVAHAEHCRIEAQVVFNVNGSDATTQAN